MTRVAPRVPAGNGSLAALAVAYSRQRAADDEFDDILGKCAASLAKEEAAASRAAWVSLAHNGQLIMRQPPRSSGDMLITLGMAASYIDCIAGQLDHADEVICRGIEAALHNAFKFLIEQGATDGMPVSVSPLIEEFCRNTGAPERGPAPEAKAA